MPRLICRVNKSLWGKNTCATQSFCKFFWHGKPRDQILMSEKNNRSKEDCCLEVPGYMICEFLILSPLYWPK